MSSGSHLSKSFFDVIKAIGESKSKQEEDRIITLEVQELKKQLSDRTCVGKKLKEFLLRILYVEMLGHNGSFGYMKAVELSASSNLLEKRVAYLVAGLCFGPDHDFRMMLVNRLQRDLQSANVLELAIALPAAARILTVDMIPAVLPLVSNLLKHDQEIVRKKAIMVLQRFHQLQPESVSHMTDKFRRVLCDKDPSVMSASLHLFYDLARADPSQYKDLVSSFVSILKQITEHRLPRDFDYHRIPAPWIQLKLLRILAVLGQSDRVASEQMYEVLLEVMRRADTGINVGFAIVYECVRTVTTIYPNTTLLDAAAHAIGRFITSENHNFKYLGVTGLAAIVKDHPRYAAEHQLAVIDCLEDPDETLKRKTLDLLFRMTNPVNVTVIVDKLMAHLKTATDVFMRTDLVSRITQAAERFAPSNEWYISTITQVFELGGDLVRPEAAHNLMRLIAEGAGESEEADTALRREAVEGLLRVSEKPSLPDILLCVMFWTLSEYGYLSTSASLPAIVDKICELAERPTLQVSTRGYALSALCKLTAQLGSATPATLALMSKYANSRSVALAQYAHEFNALVVRLPLMRAVLPVDASTEDVDVDENLAFLNGFVAEAEAAGARAYAPPAHEESEYGHAGPAHTAALRFDAYERPDPTISSAAMLSELHLGGGSGSGALPPVDATPPSTTLPIESGLNLSGVKGVWGREGYKLPQAPAPAPAPAAPGGYALPYSAPMSAAPAPAPYAAAPAPAPAPAATTPHMPHSAFAAPPRELTEKEKLAASLFGGMTTAAPQPKPAATAGFGAARAPAPVPVPAPIPAPAPAPAPAAAFEDDLLGIFGGAAPAPAPAPAAVPRAYDPFGSSMFGGGAPAPAAGPVDVSHAQLPASLAPVVMGARREPAGSNSVVGANATAVLAVQKLFAADALHLAVFVGAAAGGLRDTTLSIVLPPFLGGTVRTSANNMPAPLASGVPVHGGALAGASTAVWLFSLSLTALPSSPAASLSLQLAHSAGSLSATVEVTFADVLRPAPMDVAAFGQEWTKGTLRAEQVVTLPASSVRSPSDFMRAAAALNWHPVQAIDATSEAIVSARLMLPSTAGVAPVLMHARILPSSACELRVKSPDATLTASVCAGLHMALKA